MPTTRHRRRRERRSDFDILHLGALLTGHCYFVYSNRQDIGAMRIDWEEYGPRILDAWVELHPATRPWAWWRWNSTEPRALIAGVWPWSEAGPEQYLDKPDDFWFGVP